MTKKTVIFTRPISIDEDIYSEIGNMLIKEFPKREG